MTKGGKQKRGMGSNFNRTQMDSPCKECHKQGKNYTACHDTCAAYLEAKAKNEEWKKRVKKAKEEQKRIDVYHYEQVVKKIRQKESKRKGY